jgi:hypothetical protein
VPAILILAMNHTVRGDVHRSIVLTTKWLKGEAPSTPAVILNERIIHSNQKIYNNNIKNNKATRLSPVAEEEHCHRTYHRSTDEND